jgi:hypothetical protein
MKILNKLEAYAKIVTSKGKIFTAEFVKKDGTLRRMNCRLGVKKGITGKGLKFVPMEKLLLPVFDMQKDEYRMINLDTVYALTISKVRFMVV